MAGTFIPETTQIEEDVLWWESWPLESEPWSILYRMGEMMRERQMSADHQTITSQGASHRPEDVCCDEAAALRTDDEGCPNEPAATRPDAARYSGIGGRLLLCG